jgi:hypothetical protein
MSDNNAGKQSELSSDQLRALREALTERLRDMRARRDRTLDVLEAAQLQRRIDETKKQVDTLAVEESIQKFVEDAERYTIMQSSISEELSRDPDEEVG